MSIYTKRIPWHCSEACLHWKLQRKEQAVVSESCPAPPHPWHSLHSVLLFNGHPWTCHSTSTAFSTTQCSLQESERDGQAWKTSWLSIFKMFALFLQREDKATMRCRLYDFQSALTTNTANWLQSWQHVSGWDTSPLHASPSHLPCSLSSLVQGVKPKLNTISGSWPSKRRQNKPLPQL